MKIIRKLPKEVLNHLWKFEYNKWADKEKQRNIEEELNSFGWSLKDKSFIGEYNDLRGYLDCDIIPYEEDKN